ncbi:hypothetical protein PV08_06644 [Exophiala spinifera]|uniref:Uncharacterized protein n=1 Tax=Exophiala spinifera TaxID=91928 RepID=A0A0D2BRI2_9EURO|nr:uncharacterized protein PV08_06644 [Exophiala spinifera]KIW13864.1 hypothetical protein PV08_06644 [Exophiala spinifera]
MSDNGIQQRRVRIKDPQGRMFHFPLELCDSYFALMRAVVIACQKDADGTVESFRIMDEKGDEITAEDWLAYCARQRGTFIDVWVRVLSTAPQLPDLDSGLSVVLRKRSRSMSGDESLHESATEQTDKLPDTPSNTADRRYLSTGSSNALILYDKKRPVAGDEERNKSLALAMSKAKSQHQAGVKLPPNRVPRFLLQPQVPTIMNFTFPDLKLEDIFYRHQPVVKRQSENSEREAANVEVDSRSDSQTSKDSGNAQKISEDGSDRRSNARSDERSDERSDGASDGSSDSFIVPRVPPFFLWPIDTVSGRRSAAQKRTSSHIDVADDAVDHARSGVREGREAAERNPLTKEQEKDLKTILKDVDIAFQKAKFDDLEYSRSRKFLAKLYKEDPGEPVDLKAIEDEYSKMSELHEPIPLSEVPSEGCSWQRALVEIMNRWEYIAISFYPEETDDKVHQKLTLSRARFFKDICALCEPQFYWSKITADGLAQYNEEGQTPVFINNSSQVVDARIPRSTVQSEKKCYECKLDGDDLAEFATPDAARAHLREKHFEPGTAPDAELDRYIVPANRVIDFIACADSHRLMLKMLDHLGAMAQLIADIREGVTSTGLFDSSTYRLPLSLVQAFRQFLAGTIYAAHVAFTARINYQDTPKNGRRVRRLIEPEQMDNIVIYGADVETSLSKAKNDLMLMSHAGDYSSSASYEAVGPAYVLLTLLRDLYERTNAKDGLNLLGMYKDHIGRLDFQVKHHPRRRLRKDIVHFREEIRTVQQIINEQSDMITQFCRTLRPASFKVTSPQRVEQHKLEEQALEHVQSLGRSNRQVYDRHTRKLKRLEQEVLEGVEIEQDDHGKAILVFTIVTVVFLPLSFATSFLGMNTSDIRSTNSTQWLFGPSPCR